MKDETMQAFQNFNSVNGAPLKFGKDKYFHPTPYYGREYLSMLGIKLVHAF